MFRGFFNIWVFHSWLYGRALEARVREFEPLHPDNADVAKLVDALVLETSTKVWGFESLHPYNAPLAQPVEASDLKSVQCMFESYREYKDAPLVQLDRMGGFEPRDEGSNPSGDTYGGYSLFV